MEPKILIRGFIMSDTNHDHIKRTDRNPNWSATLKSSSLAEMITLGILRSKLHDATGERRRANGGGAGAGVRNVRTKIE